MNENLNKVKQILKNNKQEHVIPFLEDGKNTELIKQVLEIDFDELKANEKTEVKLKNIEPIIALNPKKISKEQIEKYENIGIDVIKQNKFAVTTMAGRSRN